MTILVPNITTEDDSPLSFWRFWHQLKLWRHEISPEVEGVETPVQQFRGRAGSMPPPQLVCASPPPPWFITELKLHNSGEQIQEPPNFPSIFQGFPNFPSIFQGFPNFPSIFQGFPNFSKVFLQFLAFFCDVFLVEFEALRAPLLRKARAGLDTAWAAQESG